jgi:membrane protease YdiL (CAAX protease family)
MAVMEPSTDAPATGSAPPAPAGRRTLAEEVLVVLALSILASASYAILSLFENPIAGVVVAAADRSDAFARQVLGFVFGLAPAALVLHLVRRSGEGPSAIGLGAPAPLDVARGTALALVVGLAGLGIYLGAVKLGVNRFVLPIPPEGHWWTVPAIVMNAVEAAAVEEIVVLGYLLTRLQQLSWSVPGAVAGSAFLRGAYHLYQGWGGFAGNLAMGALFGVLFLRWRRRTWPFLATHALIDVGAGVGFLLWGDLLPGF